MIRLFATVVLGLLAVLLACCKSARNWLDYSTLKKALHVRDGSISRLEPLILGRPLLPQKRTFRS